MRKLISEQLSRIEQSGYIPLLMVTVCIQGGIILSQFMVAFFITPSEIGVIRAIESVLSILVLVGSLGMQSLSIREIAADQEKINRLDILRNIYVIIIIGALFIFFAIFLGRSLLKQTVILDNILMISGVIFLTNAIRVTSGFTQGAGLVGKTYLYLMASTMVALAVNVIATFYWSVTGWIVGRYISELITLTVLISIIYKLVRPIAYHSPISLKQIKRLLHDGFKINTALIVKLIGDNLPVLMMTALKLPTDKIGFLGLAILTINSAMLPLAVLAQRAFPVMSRHRFKSKELKKLTNALVKTSLRLSLLVSVAMFVISVFLYKRLAGVYTEAFILTAVLCLALPLKSIALAYGTNLVAASRLNAAIRINSMEVVVLITVGMVAMKLWGVFGLVFSIILASSWSAIAHWALVERGRLNIDSERDLEEKS